MKSIKLSEATDDLPLSDPLWTIRRFVSGLLLLLTGTAVLACLWSIFQEQFSADNQVFLGIAMLALAILAPGLLLVLSILPSMPTNLIYLRSFQNDQASGSVRSAIQQALGRGFRLSGIRDPRRRQSWLDYLSLTIFLLRYATPKYMNLEAGGNWRGRLCRTFPQLKCGVIDVMEMTPFVLEEIRLADQALGLKRLLFVADDSATIEEWRERIAEWLPCRPQQLEQIQVARWSFTKSETRRRFRQEVRGFADRLPVGIVGHHSGVDNALADSAGKFDIGDAASGHDASFWWKFLTVLFASVGVGCLLNAIIPILGNHVSNGLVIATFGVIAWYLLWYLVDCGSHEKRLQATLGLLVVCGSYSAFFVAASHIREAALRAASRNNLSRIGVAIHMYESFWRKLPPPGAEYDRHAVPQISWQTNLLPFINHRPLFDQIDPGQSWDSVENKRQFATRVKGYLSPGIDEQLSDHGYALSHYAGNSDVFGQDKPRKWHEFQDGLGQTFLAGEVEDLFRPWGDPTNHRSAKVGIKQDSNSFGRRFSNGATFLFGDGTVHFLSENIDPKVFEALGTPDGKEDISIELPR